MRNVLFNLIAVVLGFSVQGCWAESLDQNDKESSVSGSPLNIVSVSDESLEILLDGEVVKLPQDCGKNRGGIKVCDESVFKFLGRKGDSKLYEIYVGARESDEYSGFYLLHGPSKSLIGIYRGSRIAPGNNRVLTFSGYDLFWFPHIVNIYKVDASGFHLEFSENLEKYSPGSRSSLWIGDFVWENDSSVIAKLIDKNEKPTGKAFRLKLEANDWVIGEVFSIDASD